MRKLIIIIFLFSTVAIFAQVERPKTDLSTATIAEIGLAIADSSTASTSVAVPVNYVVPNQGASVAWTSITTITLSGLPVTIASNCQVVYVQAIIADSNRFYMQGVSDINLSYSGGVITIAGADETKPFPKTASFSVGLNVPQWALDYTLNAQRMYQINARELKTANELVLNEADQDSASSTSVIIDLLASGYNKFSLHTHLEAVGAQDSINMKIYGTNNPDAVATTLSWWNDVTNDVTGSSIITVQSATLDSTFYNRTTPFNFYRIMIRVDYWLKAAATENNEAIIYVGRSN